MGNQNPKQSQQETLQGPAFAFAFAFACAYA
jgi:hypothetical protein